MSFFTLNLLENALGLAFKTKTVAIYAGTKEVLTGLPFFETTIMSCNVMDDSKLMEHPIESGAVVTDHKVFNPVEIDIRLCMPSLMYATVYKELRTIYKESTELRIGTKMAWYPRMVLQSLPHEEKAENVDRVVFDLHFKEVLEVSPQYIKMPLNKVSNPENSSTQKLGENVNKKTSSTSILATGVKEIGSWF